MTKIKRIKFFQWIILCLASLLTVSCYPDYDKEVEDYDVVITMKNDETFSSNDGQSTITTYFLADTIIHVADSSKKELDPEFPRDYDQDILNAVVANLTALGYERIDTTNTSIEPDVVVSVSALALRNTVIYTYYPGYWWGGDYWYDYWWGYPGYWPVYPPYYHSGYSYNKGSVFIDMVSHNAEAISAFSVVAEWTGIYNGLLYKGNTPTTERITDGIDKIFEKSPYLDYIAN